MKKLLTYIVLIIFIFNLTGYFIVFKGLQNSIRSEIRQQIRHNPLLLQIEVLTFSKADLRENKIILEWEKDDEFCFNNFMYDVINQKESTDSISYICFNDHKEKKLIDQFQANISQQHENSKSRYPNPLKIMENLIKDYCYQSFSVQNFNDGIKINLPHITEPFFDTFSDVLIPPPKLLTS